MQLTLRHQLMQFSHTLQQGLFPVVEEAVGELGAAARLLVAIINMTPLRRFIPMAQGWKGRPQKDRYAIACAFLAKAAVWLAPYRTNSARVYLLPRICRVRRHGTRTVCA